MKFIKTATCYIKLEVFVEENTMSSSKIDLGDKYIHVYIYFFENFQTCWIFVWILFFFRFVFGILQYSFIPTWFCFMLKQILLSLRILQSLGLISTPFPSKWILTPLYLLQCSATCGGGIKSRLVLCRLSSGRTLADTSCNTLSRPVDTRLCSTNPCPSRASWRTNPWNLVGRHWCYFG